MYNIPGTKAILVIGIMAMCMSTADSNLNICAVLLANDCFFSKKLNPIQKIFWARNFTLGLGAVSFILAFWKMPLFKFILFHASFYLPIISVPLLGIVFKLTTSSRVCLSVMIICFCSLIIFKNLYPDTDFNFIGMILNAILLITGHYIVEKWELLKCFGIRSKLKGK
jgi:Na+/proline symporter